MRNIWSAPSFTCEQIDICDEFSLVIRRRADRQECWISDDNGGLLLRQMILAKPADVPFIDELLARAFDARAVISQPPSHVKKACRRVSEALAKAA